MSQQSRRYDIDWIRVIAIGLLLIYHVAIGFQRWGIMIGFIANDRPWESLWIPMTMLNIWRIPLLFFVSGMGVYFSMQNRTWSGLMRERGLRILVPFLFGIFIIVPIASSIWRYYYHWEQVYEPNPAHLWFLGNIFVYVFTLSPVLFYMKRNESNKLVMGMKKLLQNPLSLLLVIVVIIGEAMLTKPYPYTLYAMTWHGFFLGLAAFFFGFCFALAGDPFRQMMIRWRWLFLVIAASLFTFRLIKLGAFPPNCFLSIESCCWIFTVFAFAFRYLNRPGKALTYLSEAAYPVYILHMIFLFLGSLLIFPLNIPSPAQFVLVLVFTFAGCFATYEVIRRINLLRPLFGLKKRSFS